MLSHIHFRTLVTLISLPPWLAFVSSAVGAVTLVENYPKAQAAFPLIEQHPLLMEILLDDGFFDRLDQDEAFRERMIERLSDPVYRSALTALPPLECSVAEGGLRKWASIKLRFQVEVFIKAQLNEDRITELRDYYSAAGVSKTDAAEFERLVKALERAHWTEPPGALTVRNLPTFKKMVEELLPEDHERLKKNAIESLDQVLEFYAPFTKMKEAGPITEQRKIGGAFLNDGLRDGFRVDSRHPRVRAVKREISAFSCRVLGTQEEMRARLVRELETLVDAFKPYGAKVLENPPGHYGVQITDRFCILLRDFILYDKPANTSGNAYDAHIEITLTRSPDRALPRGFLPSFPGAEGFGTWTAGGRGGKVIYVTNLNPEGPGSLREALQTPGPRIVLFAVSGSIKGSFGITEPNLTLIGHTAPGEGVELDGTLHIEASDIIARGICWRKLPPSGADVMKTEGRRSGIVFDHCEWAYGADELINFYNGGNLVSGTFQFCMIGPAMENVGGHPFGPTGSGTVSLHHNILCHLTGRTPKAGGQHHDWRNNLIYNCDRGYVRGDGTEFNLINNYVIDKTYDYQFSGAETLYSSGNIREGGGEPLVRWDKGRYGRIVGKPYPKRPLHTMPISTVPAGKVPEIVLPLAGPILPTRDAMEIYCVKSIQDRTGKPPFFIRPADEESDKVRKVFDPKLYDTWTHQKFPPPAAGAKPYRDSDSDGMPDWWEKEHGFEANAARDGSFDKDGDGYTNVEEFINDTNPNQYVDYTLGRNNIHSLHKKNCIHSAQWRDSHPRN